MLKIFFLTLIIIIFFSFALVMKMLIKGEEKIKGAGCSDSKNSHPPGCSHCGQRTGDVCSIK